MDMFEEIYNEIGDLQKRIEEIKKEEYERGYNDAMHEMYPERFARENSSK